MIKDNPEGQKSFADWLDGVEPDCFSSESLDTASHLFWNKGQAMDYGFHRTKHYSADKVISILEKYAAERDAEVAKLNEKIVAQQARILNLRLYQLNDRDLETDDLSALAEHDAKLLEGQAGEMAALAKALNSLYKSPFGQGDYEAAKQALANAGY
jgi:hypothetical protein